MYIAFALTLANFNPNHLYLVPKETVIFSPISSFQGGLTQDSEEAWQAFLGRMFLQLKFFTVVSNVKLSLPRPDST